MLHRRYLGGHPQTRSHTSTARSRSQSIHTGHSQTVNMRTCDATSRNCEVSRRRGRHVYRFASANKYFASCRSTGSLRAGSVGLDVLSSSHASREAVSQGIATVQTTSRLGRTVLLHDTLRRDATSHQLDLIRAVNTDAGDSPTTALPTWIPNITAPRPAPESALREDCIRSAARLMLPGSPISQL